MNCCGNCCGFYAFNPSDELELAVAIGQFGKFDLTLAL